MIDNEHDTPIADGRISPLDALRILADSRHDDAIVVTNQGSARLWPLVAEHPLDFHYNPSTMGGAVPFAQGLALAAVPREVIVVSGDGALVMSLGSLVSVVAAGAANLTVVVLENGIYEVTGGQRTPAAAARLDFSAIAHGIGFPTARRFTSAADWRSSAKSVLAAPGPRFIALVVESARPADLATAATPLTAQLDRLRRKLSA